MDSDQVGELLAPMPARSILAVAKLLAILRFNLFFFSFFFFFCFVKSLEQFCLDVWNILQAVYIVLSQLQKQQNSTRSIENLRAMGQLLKHHFRLLIKVASFSFICLIFFPYLCCRYIKCFSSHT